jgi:hypothetical protein
MESPIQPEPQKSNTGLMIGAGVAVALVLICCCLLVGVIAALTIMGPVVGKVYSTIDNIPQMPSGMPTISDFPTMSPDATMPSLSDVIPTGGNGTDVQRTQAWAQLFIAATVSGCSIDSPSAIPDTKIKVTQEANGDGVWVEEWTVPCSDGTNKAFTVTFTPGKNGDTDIQVK